MINVLIADDHAIVRQGLKQILSDIPDMRVGGEAADGQEALHEVRNKAYDVLVLDLSMPGMSGDETYARIREDFPDLPVLCCSGHGEKAGADWVRGKSNVGFLSKPFTYRELVDPLRKLLSSVTSMSPESV